MDTEKLRVLKKIKDRVTSIRDDLYAVIDETINALTPGKYDHGDLPGDPGTGAILFDTTRKEMTWFNTDHYEYPTHIEKDDTLVEDQTVSNTTTKTQVHSIDIPAGSMVEGRVFEVYASGKFTTASTSDDFTIHIDIEGTEIATMSSAGQNVSDAPWDVLTTFTVRDVSGDLQVMPHSRGSFNAETDDDHHDQTQVDETTASAVQISLSWNNAKAGNSVTLAQSYLKTHA